MLFTLVCFGCSTIVATADLESDRQPTKVFSHELFERVLQRYASEYGTIDYEALQRFPDELNRYYQLIAAVSPDSQPQLFPTANYRLAYWINAYNAAAIRIVIDHYPIESVREVKRPTLLFFLPVESGFFVFQKPMIGGRPISLYNMENKIIRRRFADPRIHFALNCASLGCPRLPPKPFTGEMLDDQLERETRRFMDEERNVRIDHQSRTIFLSKIFQWYEDDFRNWLRKNDPETPPRLPRYVLRYLSEEKALECNKIQDSYSVSFSDYDWRLNDSRNYKKINKKATAVRSGS